MNTETDTELAEKIAAFDALFADDDDTTSTAEPTLEDQRAALGLSEADPDTGAYCRPSRQVPPRDPIPVPLVDQNPRAPDEPDDMVVAMQELLLKHEDTQLNRVEDPDLVRVLQELRVLAHSNIADVFSCDEVMEYIGLDDNEEPIYKASSRMVVRDITSIPREVSACIQSIKVTSKPEGDVVEVKLYDKQVSLDKLMRFHGAYVKDNEQNTQNTGVMDLLLSSIGTQGMPTIVNNDA